MEFYDLHNHTKLSLCAARTSEIDDYVRIADAEGMKVIGFSDHAWDSGLGLPTDFYAPQNYERLFDRKVNISHKVKVVYGAEGEYAQGLLAVRPETAKKLDYLIVPHSHTHMRGFVLPEGCEAPHAHGRYLFNSFVSLMHHPNADLIFGVAHPFDACGQTFEQMNEILSAISDEEFVYCGKLASQNGIFLEMNAAAVSKAPVDKADISQYGRFFRMVKKGGAQFFLGSDNHTPKVKDENKLYRLPDYMEAYGLTEDDFKAALNRISLL